MEDTADANTTKTTLFSEEEVRDIYGFKSGCSSGSGGSGGDHYVEVTCGCTSHRYGDAVGRLRVFSSGLLEITCKCFAGCPKDKLTPAAFEKHSRRETSRKWKNNIWVTVDGEKVPLYKTALLKYYNQASKSANGSSRSHNGKVHRDEFVRCTECNKERRFHLRNKQECRSYHDALADLNWKCSDMPYDEVTCDDDEERASRRRVYRGCSRSSTCNGCTSCVCFGCEICRFSDCSCQTCSDFTRNAKA